MDGATARFRAEAAALARLSHPGIAIVYELVEDDGHLVMAMEYVRGQSLQQILEQVGVFSPRRAAELCMQALAALQHAHAAGVIHRDLKPGNLMLTESGALKIMDFGIARLEGGVNLTSVGTMLGTPAYMAPEQVLGHPIDARADLYAMGIVLFRLVTAALPFKAETPFDMAQSQVNDPPAKARDERSDLPEWVDDILTRALAKKPGDRFQSAMEFHEAFARALAHSQEPAVARVTENTEVMARPDFEPPAGVPDVVTSVHEEESPAAMAEVATAGRRARARAWRLTAAAAAAVVASIWASIWMFTPRNPALPDAPTTATAFLAESARPTSIDPDTVTVAPATFASGAAPDRPLKTPKPESPVDAPALPALSFHDVKLLAVDGARTSTLDVVVQFSGADITVQSANGKAASATLPYQGISKATYANGRDPKWDPAFSGPADKIEVSGIFGRARRWLVLQNANTYVILRLDGADWREIVKALEDRARIVIDRPAAVKHPD
jgi:hypothetical protein